MEIPNIQSRLIETPSPSEGADAPRTGTVLVVGRAGKGPTEPIEFEERDGPYEVYGREGELAKALELAISGAEQGAAVAGSNAIPRVVGLRLPTGTAASATLYSDPGKTQKVMRVETANASDEANGYKVTTSDQSITIHQPNGEKATFQIDRSGESAGRAGSPLELADAIRDVFEDELFVEVDTREARFELSLNDQAPIIESSELRTELDFRGVDTGTVDGLGSPIGVTWIDQVSNYDFSTGEAIYNRDIPSELNRDARFYSVTAGSAKVVPKGVESIELEGLAPSAVVSDGSTQSLLNIRTDDELGPVSLAECGQDPDGAVSSEAYERARQRFVGRLNLSATEAFFVDDTTGEILETDPGDGSATEQSFVTLTFDAPNGIADSAGPLAALYATELGGGWDATSVDTDRLGEQFATGHADCLKLFLQKEGVNQPVEEIAIDITGTGTSGIPAEVFWDAANSNEAKIVLRADRVDADFDEAYTYVSYDSCVFPIVERENATQFNGPTLQYYVDGNEVIFNKETETQLVVRGQRVSQYRLGSEIQVDRRDGENIFVITGENQQPGAGGGPISGIETVFGFDYTYAPDWPEKGTIRLDGGSSGANASVEATIQAMDEALEAHKNVQYEIIVPAGVYIDDTVEGYDPITGVRKKENAGLIDVLMDHQKRVDAIGASGITYCSVKPLLPAAQTGRYTDEQKRQRFLELAQTDASDNLRPASVLSGYNLPQFFVFDAAMQATIAGQTYYSDAAPFVAGVRSALGNGTALYQVEMPNYIQPLYRYDLAGVNMPSELSGARINTWSERRGENRLVDERTAAGTVADGRGRQVPSGWQSGIALLTANTFRQDAVNKLRTLVGPLPKGGVDQIRAAAATMLQDAARSNEGVRRLNFDQDRDIRIRAEGGNAYGMYIRLFLQVAGEMRVIDLEVGATTEAQATGSEETGSSIPMAQ